MDEVTRNRICREAADTIERLRNIEHEERPERTSWKAPQPEPPKPRERGLDTAPVDWDAVINTRLVATKDYMLEAIGQAIAEVIRIERSHHADELKTQAVHFEAVLAKHEAEVARLALRVVELTHDRERNKVLDLPQWPSRKGLN
jgi:hypothetical protein